MKIVLLMLLAVTAVFADVSHLGTNLQDDGYHYEKPPIPFPSNDITTSQGSRDGPQGPYGAQGPSVSQAPSDPQGSFENQGPYRPQGPSGGQSGLQRPTSTGTKNKPPQIEYLPPQKQQPSRNQTPGSYSTSPLQPGYQMGRQPLQQQPGYNSDSPSQVSEGYGSNTYPTPQSQQPGFSTNAPSLRQPDRDARPSYNPRFGMSTSNQPGERPFQGSGLIKPGSGTQYIPPRPGQNSALENGSDRPPVQPGQRYGNIPVTDTIPSTRDQENENNVKPSTGYRPEERPSSQSFTPSQPQPGPGQLGAEYLPPNQLPGVSQQPPISPQPDLQSGTGKIPSQPTYPQSLGQTPDPSYPSKSDTQPGYPQQPQQPQFQPFSNRPILPEFPVGSSKEPEPAHSFGPDGYKYKVPNNQLQY